MPTVQQKGNKDKYTVVDRKCLGCVCFQPGWYQTRGAVGAAGTRNTGQSSPCCLYNAYHGCPDEAAKGYTPEQEAERKKEGWKNV